MNNTQFGFNPDYEEEAITLDQLNELPGNAILEFGTAWCGHCQAASSAIKEVLSEHPELPHIKIADGKGKVLGRAFKVKLWPTLIYLHNGAEVARLVRPLQSNEVRDFISKTA